MSEHTIWQKVISVGLYEMLVKQYGINEPIFFSELKYRDYSQIWLSKELSRLCAAEKLARFENGVYYIPIRTALGPGLLSPRKVIEKKYVQSGGETIGYYSGVTFLNQIGLSTQMPNVLEIYTNRESAKVRQVTVGWQKVILRKARTTITSKNAAVQSLFELMNSLPATFFNEERRRLTSKFIWENRITRDDIAEYAKAFPDKALRTLVESMVIYDVAP